MITIGKPTVSETESGKYSRLSSLIDVEGEQKFEVWYEVEKKYAEYLCYERADAFVVGILPLAMAFGRDIKVQDCPLSQQLYWSLTNTYIPALSKYSNYYRPIKIECSLDNTVFSSTAVGTGFSAGVDSFYTYLKNRNTEMSDFNITHLTFFNVGACGSYGGEEAEKRYEKRIQAFEGFVKEQGLEYVKINSNISELIRMSYNFTHSFRSMSAVLAVQKLFKKYYYSAGHTLDEFSFNPYDSSFYDLLNAQAFSTENTTFYTTGAVESRLEKVEYISQFPETYDILNVCNTNDENCRTCEKCIRTMSDLYAINKLEKYSAVFDVEYFKQHLVRNIAFDLSKSKDGTIEALYFKEIIDMMKKNGVKVPALSYLVSVPMAIKFKGMAIARKSKTLKKLWHKKMAKQGIRFNDLD